MDEFENINYLKSYSELTETILEILNDIYWKPMRAYIKENSVKLENINCLLLNFETLCFYLGKNHIAIEYCGNPFDKAVKLNRNTNVIIRDYTQEFSNKEFINKIIGFNYNDSTSKISIPLTVGIHEDLIIPTNAGADKLSDLKWNFAAQNSIVGFNISGINIEDDQFVRLINCTFFDEQQGDLKTRIIKWIDFIPWKHEESDDGETDAIQLDIRMYSELWEYDILYHYNIPDDYKFSKLPLINRFIECFGNSNNTEPQITEYLSQTQNNFILTMAFGATHIYSQLKCEWQSEDKNSIIPDFFILKANGYADIVEFKLPNLKGKSIVGTSNREHFSAELNSYIAQTRVYTQYFEDPNNRKWFHNKYGFNVHNPKRYLVVGRRTDFSYDEWIGIQSDYKNIEIITYDDLVDTVCCQFYK